MTKFNKELIVQPNVGVFCKTKEESYQLREFSLTHFNNGGTVSQTNANKLYPLTVKFDKFVTPTAEWFTSDGRSNSNNKAPDLFHTRVTITPIEKQEPVYEYKWIQIRNGKAFETKGYYVDQTEIPAQEPEFWNCCETYKIEGSKQERVIL